MDTIYLTVIEMWMFYVENKNITTDSQISGSPLIYAFHFQSSSANSAAGNHNPAKIATTYLALSLSEIAYKHGTER